MYAKVSFLIDNPPLNEYVVKKQLKLLLLFSRPYDVIS